MEKKYIYTIKVMLKKVTFLFVNLNYVMLQLQ